jgi:hypothetical protein
VKQDGRKVDRPTKNRRRRIVALDDRSLALLAEQIATVDEWADAVGAPVIDDP